MNRDMLREAAIEAGFVQGIDGDWYLPPAGDLFDELHDGFIPTIASLLRKRARNKPGALTYTLGVVLFPDSAYDRYVHYAAVLEYATDIHVIAGAMLTIDKWTEKQAKEFVASAR